MSEELKACPFCGSKAIAWHSPEDGACPHVFCTDSVSCGADLTLHEPGQDARVAWNKRADQQRLEAENRQMREALEKAAGWFEAYAVEHYDKAIKANDYREQGSREDKGRLNRERGKELLASLPVQP